MPELIDSNAAEQDSAFFVENLRDQIELDRRELDDDLQLIRESEESRMEADYGNVFAVNPAELKNLESDMRDEWRRTSPQEWDEWQSGQRQTERDRRAVTQAMELSEPVRKRLEGKGLSVDDFYVAEREYRQIRTEWQDYLEENLPDEVVKQRNKAIRTMAIAGGLDPDKVMNEMMTPEWARRLQLKGKSRAHFHEARDTFHRLTTEYPDGKMPNELLSKFRDQVRVLDVATGRESKEIGSPIINDKAREEDEIYAIIQSNQFQSMEPLHLARVHERGLDAQSFRESVQTFFAQHGSKEDENYRAARDVLKAALGMKVDLPWRTPVEDLQPSLRPFAMAPLLGEFERHRQQAQNLPGVLPPGVPNGIRSRMGIFASDAPSDWHEINDKLAEVDAFKTAWDLPDAISASARLQVPPEELDFFTGQGLGLARGFVQIKSGFHGVTRMIDDYFNGTDSERSQIDEMVYRRYLGQLQRLHGSASTEGREFDASNWRSWTEGVAEFAPQLAVQAGVSPLGGSSLIGRIATFAGTGGAMEAGLTYNASMSRLLQSGMTPEEAQSIAGTQAMVVGSINSAIEIVPGAVLLNRNPATSQLFRKTILQRLKQLAVLAPKSYFAEGFEESMQEIVQDAARFVFEKDPDAFNDTVPNAIRAGLLGGATGAGMSTVTVGIADPVRELMEGRITESQFKRALDGMESAEQREVARQYYTDPETAAEWARNNPEAARNLVEKGRFSQKAFNEADSNLPEMTGQGDDKVIRKQWFEQVKGELDKAPAETTEEKATEASKETITGKAVETVPMQQAVESAKQEVNQIREQTGGVEKTRSQEEEIIAAVNEIAEETGSDADQIYGEVMAEQEGSARFEQKLSQQTDEFTSFLATKPETGASISSAGTGFEIAGSKNLRGGAKEYTVKAVDSEGMDVGNPVQLRVNNKGGITKSSLKGLGEFMREVRLSSNAASLPAVSEGDVETRSHRLKEKSVDEIIQSTEKTAQAEGSFGGGEIPVQPDRVPVIGDAAIPSVLRFDGNEEMDRRMNEQVPMKKAGFIESCKECFVGIGKAITRTRRHVRRTEENAPFLDLLRTFEEGPKAAQDEALRVVASIVDPMTPNEVSLFERKLMLDNLIYAISQGQPLRFGAESPSEIANHLDEVNQAITAFPRIQEAINIREQFRQNIVRRLVDADLLGEEVIDNGAYFHHQIQDRVAAQKSGSLTANPARVVKSFRKKRVEGVESLGEKYDPNVSYVEAEAEWMADALFDLSKEQFLGDVKRIYDRRDEIQAEIGEDGDLETAVRRDDSLMTWSPEPGNMFYRAHTVAEKIAADLEAGVIEEAEITKDDIRATYVVAAKRPAMVLPVEVAEELHSMTRPEVNSTTNILSDFSKGVLGLWKRYTLFLRPKGIIPYQIRNMTGDIDVVIAANPQIIGKMWQAANELSGYFRQTTKAVSQELREALDLAVIDSSMVATEIGDVSDLAIFRRFKKRGNFSKLVDVASDAFRLPVEFNKWREGILRYAAYLQYKDELSSGDVKHYGASHKGGIEAIRENLGDSRAAAKMARELLGDYGDLTLMDQAIRDHIFPFWSYQAINMRRYPMIVANSINAGSIGRGAVAGTVYSAALLSRVMAFYALQATWNMLRYPEEEEQLGPYDRSIPHIIMGRNADGSIRVFRQVGALADLTEWFGINDLVGHLNQKWQSGQIESDTVAWEMSKAPVKKLLSALRPDVKLLGELTSGYSIWPDPENPRRVQMDESLANTVGLVDEYRYARGMILGDGTSVRKHQFERFLFGVVDPRHAALSEVYDLLDMYKSSKGEEIRSAGQISKYRNARHAAVNEDYDAFVQWRRKFIAESDSVESAYKNFYTYLDRIDPVSRLRVEQREEFANEFLSDDQRIKLEIARQFSKELGDTMWQWWEADSRQNDSQDDRFIQQVVANKMVQAKRKTLRSKTSKRKPGESLEAFQNRRDRLVKSKEKARQSLLRLTE